MAYKLKQENYNKPATWNQRHYLARKELGGSAAAHRITTRIAELRTMTRIDCNMAIKRLANAS